jgi:rhamnogalacturonyl hydrolase YesR
MSVSIPPVAIPRPEVAELTRSLQAVQRWVEARNYRGYDPGDGLTSFLRPLTLERPLAQRLLQQLVWKSPINIRPLVGVRPRDSTKGRGFMAWGYLWRHRATGDPTELARAEACLDWLDQHRVPGAAGHCWGNHFDFVTRSGCIPAHQPTIVWSGLIGQAFLEAFEQTGQARFLDIADSICRWILTLPREKTPTGACLSYVGFKQSSIHNSNMLGGALLARTWKHTGDERFRDAAQSAMAYSCSRQRPDGSWWYGEEEKYHWIDNFHTGYNLDSLKRYIESTGDQEFLPCLAQGYRYFKDTFFEPDGCPRYYHNRKFPVDIQCAAQAIDTFAFFSDHDSSALTSAVQVACWTVRHMQDSTGYFYYRRLPLITVRTPYFHWGQATTFKALAHLLGRLDS